MGPNYIFTIFISLFIILVGLAMSLNIRRLSRIIQNTEDRKVIKDLEEIKQKMEVVFVTLLLVSAVYFIYLIFS